MKIYKSFEISGSKYTHSHIYTFPMDVFFSNFFICLSIFFSTCLFTSCVYINFGCAQNEWIIYYSKLDSPTAAMNCEPCGENVWFVFNKGNQQQPLPIKVNVRCMCAKEREKDLRGDQLLLLLLMKWSNGTTTATNYFLLFLSLYQESILMFLHWIGLPVSLYLYFREIFSHFWFFTAVYLVPGSCSLDPFPISVLNKIIYVFGANKDAEINFSSFALSLSRPVSRVSVYIKVKT